MKQILMAACVAFTFAGCNNDSKKEETSTAETSAATTNSAMETKAPLPYPLTKPYKEWEIGSHQNVVNAMSALKAFADKDFAALEATIGDSMEVTFDNVNEKMTKDSAMKMFTKMRRDYGDIKVIMYDYVPVISADKNDEWVTMWYKQVWQDNKGKWDSANVVDDIKMKNGKMIQLDEKMQRIAAKK